MERERINLTRTRHNIHRHELFGLPVEVASEQCLDYNRVKGRVVDESRNMIWVLDGDEKRVVPKGVSAFRFTLPGEQSITLQGERILGRPEDRVKAQRRGEN